MEKRITVVGLDAHKVSTNVAMLLSGETVRPSSGRCHRDSVGSPDGEEGRSVWRPAPGSVLLRGRPLRVRAAALDPGDGAGVRRSGAVADSAEAGERIKTDRRDARKLAELFRAGLLTEVHPPTEADEAVRDLCRAREDAHEDLVRSRHRVSKLLLRRGWTWTEWEESVEPRAPTLAAQLRFEHAADQIVLDEYLLTIEHVEDRLAAWTDTSRA